jgi:hypothetical protein
MASTYSLAASAEAKQEFARVREAMARLPEVDRAALLLRVVESLPYEEIAAILNIRRPRPGEGESRATAPGALAMNISKEVIRDCCPSMWRAKPAPTRALVEGALAAMLPPRRSGND